MITLGITGSIGMGKSTVVAMLRDMGIPVHDADETVHRLLNIYGAAVEPVKQLFPDTVRTDDNRDYIDRALLSQVLNDDAALKTLESVLHPLVFQDAEKFKEMMELAGHPLIAFDIPLLFETQAEKRFDVTVCVSAPYAVQHSRVMARPNMTAEKLARILMRQMPDAEKRTRADFVLENDGDRNHLKVQLQSMLKAIQIRFALTNLSQHLS